MKRTKSNLDAVSKTFHKDDIDANCLTNIIFYGDLFGVNPLPVKDENYYKTSKRKHVCGCISSFIVGGAMLFVFIYSIIDQIYFRYGVSIGMVDNYGAITGSGNDNLEEGNLVPFAERFKAHVPKVAIRCCTDADVSQFDNQDRCNASGFVNVIFKQYEMVQQKKVKSEVIPHAPCQFQHFSNDYGMFFQSESHHLHCVDSDSYALEGVYEKDKYKYLQVEVESCPWDGNKSTTIGDKCHQDPNKVSAWVREAECSIYEENVQHNVSALVSGGQTYEQDIPTSANMKSSRFLYMHNTQQKIDVYHRVRRIIVQHWTIKIKELNREYSDLTFVKYEPAYKSLQALPSGGPPDSFMKFYIRMTADESIVRLVPSSDVFGILSKFGGYWALLLLLGRSVVGTCNRCCNFEKKAALHVDLATRKRSESFGEDVINPMHERAGKTSI